MPFSNNAKQDIMRRLGSSHNTERFIEYAEMCIDSVSAPINLEADEFKKKIVTKWRKVECSATEILALLEATDLERPRTLSTYHNEDERAWLKEELLNIGTIKTDDGLITERERLYQVVDDLTSNLKFFKAMLDGWKEINLKWLPKTKRGNTWVGYLCFCLVSRFHAEFGRLPSSGENSDDMVALTKILSEAGYAANENAISRIKTAIKNRRALIADGTVITKGVI